MNYLYKQPPATPKRPAHAFLTHFFLVPLEGKGEGELGQGLGLCCNGNTCCLLS